jgi:uncharacterized protein with HEPN domain
VPSRNLQQRLEDILAMGKEIEIFTAGMAFAEFEQDAKTIKAVSRLIPEVESLYPEIPWIDIRAIRNVIIHEYFRVDLSIIWETIQTDLPPLIRQLQELVERLHKEG